MMIDTLVHILSWFFLVTGGFLGVTGAIGLFRFPDFYTRLHAAGVTDTLCTVLIILGLALQSGISLVALKLILLLCILAYTAPTASHVLAKSARRKGLEPVLSEKGDVS